MRIGRMIAAGTMAMGAYRAYKEFKGHDEPSRGRGRGRLRGRQHEKHGWLASIRH